jgi:DNA replication licensing factor MCM4
MLKKLTGIDFLDIRLILSALQATAVDPKTGRIDLDLVTTGISARTRIVHEQKRHAIRQVIANIDKTSIRWIEVYRAFQDQSDGVISEGEFLSILRDLVDENYIHMTGRTNADRMIRKLRI